MRICSFQVSMSSQLTENVKTAIRSIEIAADKEADVAFLPEMMVTGWGQHLHDFFAREAWIDEVTQGLYEILKQVEKSGVRLLLGSPYSVADSYVNAIILLDPVTGIQYVGGKMLIAPGWTKNWNFVGASSKAPIMIDQILCGFVVCNEVEMLDQLEDSGIEQSQIIFWPGVTLNHYSEDGSLLHNSCAEGVRSISLRYRCPTIQASYINEINALLPTRRHGGIAVASEDGTVVYQAPDGRETLVVCDVTLEKVGGSMLTRLSLIE